MKTKEIIPSIGRITLDDVVESRAREIAREEVASLAGLVLRRLGDDPNAPLAQKLSSAFSEALRDFGGTKHAPGPEVP